MEMAFVRSAPTGGGAFFFGSQMALTGLRRGNPRPYTWSRFAMLSPGQQ
ncbi:hypothetical protein Mnod_8752 (plasmid) [Methylobacterium nodulans ORS 2060]|uniref:Uncharacterized protein n=1 Tax=Methylobacterium nodulans (strain LMG 21967 / CNCM I-2342 / ORS 2060) TaxID=460265 RepID=B8IWL5_METNO|nr:hypothetical protein Mnod_8752 [Methylobacterium nodulans ORS 2060]